MGIHSGTSAELETDVTAIKAKTDNLPASPAPANEYDTQLDVNMSTRAPANEYDIEMARITANVATEAKQDIIDTNLDRSLETKIIFSDILDSLVFSDVAADKDFPSIVFPTGFLPAGAVVDSIFIGVTWRRQVNSSVAENGVNGASKKIRIMKSGAVWGTNDIVAIDIPDNFILTDANATEGGTDILGDNDVKSEVDDVDNETYLIRTEQTQRTDAMVVDAEYLTLYDIQSFAIVYFKLSS